MNIIEKTAQELELLARHVRNLDLTKIEDMTYDADGAYAQGVGVVFSMDDVISAIEAKKKLVEQTQELADELRTLRARHGEDALNSVIERARK